MKNRLYNKFKSLPHPLRWFIVGVLGGSLTIIGLIFLILPGPGIPLILIGLGILATEFYWAERIFKKIKESKDTMMGRVNLSRRNKVIAGLGVSIVLTISSTVIYNHYLANSVKNIEKNVISAKTLKLHQECPMKLNEKDKLINCVKEYIDKSTKEKGYIATERDLEESVAINPDINKVCHPFAHYIGKGAFQESGNIKEAILNNTSFCAWGYLHGLYVEASENIKGEELFKEMIEGCLYLKELKGNYFECAHGMGDAFVHSNNSDLLIAISWCKKIEDITIRQVCSEGASNYYFDYRMVNDLFKNKVKNPKPYEVKMLEGSDIFAICREIKEDIDKLGCLDYSTHMRPLYSENLKKIEESCKKERGIYNEGCYKGLGREYAFDFNLDDKEARDKCLSSKYENGVKQCIISLIFARTQINQDIKGILYKNTCNKEFISLRQGSKDGCLKVKEMLQGYFDKEWTI